jgi:hypothetical protein
MITRFRVYLARRRHVGRHRGPLYSAGHILQMARSRPPSATLPAWLARPGPSPRVGLPAPAAFRWFPTPIGGTT